MIFGIDPGNSGALVALGARGEVIDVLPMPTVRVGTNHRVNGAAVAAWLRSHHEPGTSHAFLELVASQPGQGTRSMFTFGHAAGLVEGLLQGLGIPYTLLQPGIWKKTARLLGTDKDAARSRAIQLYPDLRVLDLKAKGQAVADALLIARAGLTLEHKQCD